MLPGNEELPNAKNNCTIPPQKVRKSGTALAEPLDAMERGGGGGGGEIRSVLKMRSVNVKECQRTLMSKSTVTYANSKKVYTTN
eukprot:scaffold14182_cov123-Skeletonema_dohrnii-CCMP3373.AAC.2